MKTILGIQRLGGPAVHQIAAHVGLAIDSPSGVGRRQIGDPEPGGYPVEHIVELRLLVGVEGPGEQLVRSLGVVDEHVEHIAVGPIGNSFAALALDRLVSRSDPIERARGRWFVGEHDLLSIARGGEEAADGVARDLSGEEQPVHRAVERELGGGAGEDEEDHVSVAPNPPNDGPPSDEIAHAIRGCKRVVKQDTLPECCGYARRCRSHFIAQSTQAGLRNATSAGPNAGPIDLGDPADSATMRLATTRVARELASDAQAPERAATVTRRLPLLGDAPCAGRKVPR